jgi:hypothetical protein
MGIGCRVARRFYKLINNRLSFGDWSAVRQGNSNAWSDYRGAIYLSMQAMPSTLSYSITNDRMNE